MSVKILKHYALTLPDSFRIRIITYYAPNINEPYRIEISTNLGAPVMESEWRRFNDGESLRQAYDDLIATIMDSNPKDSVKIRRLSC